jgi:hypothetical protein
VYEGNGHVHHFEVVDDFNRSTMEWLGR